MAPDDDHPHFISAYGDARTFHTDVVWAEDVADLETSRTHARFQLGAELFSDEHELLKRACHLWPNAQTKAALSAYEKSLAMADAMNAAGISPHDTRH
jgi:hypothetical protein